MMEARSYEQEILDQIRKLDEAGQQKVLDFARSIAPLQGTPGWLLVQDLPKLGFSNEDLEQMERAIEESCEVVDDFPEVDFDN